MIAGQPAIFKICGMDRGLCQVDEIVVKVGIGSGDSRKQTLRLTASSMTGGSNCIMNHDTAIVLLRGAG